MEPHIAHKPNHVPSSCRLVLATSALWTEEPVFVPWRQEAFDWKKMSDPYQFLFWEHTHENDCYLRREKQYRPGWLQLHHCVIGELHPAFGFNSFRRVLDRFDALMEASGKRRSAGEMELSKGHSFRHMFSGDSLVFENEGYTLGQLASLGYQASTSNILMTG